MSSAATDFSIPFLRSRRTNKWHKFADDVLPAWEPAVNKRIWDTFRLGVEYKAIKALPPEDSVISTRPQR